MRYITGIYALNMGYVGGFQDMGFTPGDWHTPCLDWDRIEYGETDNYPWDDWGIEEGVIPYSVPKRKAMKANHIRACLDLVADGRYGAAQGMRDGYICNEHYTEKVFEMALYLKGSEKWEDVNRFMGNEYQGDWLDYLERTGNEQRRA